MKKFLQLPDVITIVADESVDFRIVVGLRNAGVHVIAICEDTPSLSDIEVLRLSVKNNALLITEDKDFGELAFRFQLEHFGILLIRIENANFKIDIVTNVVCTHFFEIFKKFSVLTKDRLRISSV